MFEIDYAQLYKIAVDEEHRELEAHQARVAFVTGVISALFAGTIAGAIQAKHSYDYLLLLTGPLLILVVAMIARRVSTQFYERFLDAIIVRAKLEQFLGLTEPIATTHEEAYWPGEPFVAPRRLKSRRNARHATSAAWQEAHIDTGYNRSAHQLFAASIGVAGLLAAALIVAFAL